MLAKALLTPENARKSASLVSSMSVIRITSKQTTLNVAAAAAASVTSSTNNRFYSTTTPNLAKVNNNNSSRPRRRTPKAFHQPPQIKTRLKNGKTKTIALRSSTSPNQTLESQFGPEAAGNIRSFRRTNETYGALTPHNMSLSHDEVMRAADFLTADIGSTEDLVGQRRALMDAWDDEDPEFLESEIERIIAEERDNTWDGESWHKDQIAKEKRELRENKMAYNAEDDVDPQQKAFGPWSETIVRVDRVQKVQRGGTMVRYRALVVGGNLNGCAGFGIAKANAPNEACAAAARMCKRNIFFVDRYMNSGLTTSLVGKHNSCKVILRAVNPNRGLHGHELITQILKYFGITDCSAKSHGNRNVFNVVYATFKALMTHESLEDIALKRGKRLLYVERAKRLSI